MTQTHTADNVNVPDAHKLRKDANGQTTWGSSMIQSIVTGLAVSTVGTGIIIWAFAVVLVADTMQKLTRRAKRR